MSRRKDRHSAARLSPSEVHLWRADLDAEAAPPGDVLTDAERERAARLRAAVDGRRWAASRWALREVLGRYLGEPAGEIELALGEHGKPALAFAPERLEFNLSHSGGLALVAVAARPVGVDVERIEAGRDVLALAERALDPAAAEAVRAADPAARETVFFAAWARHEARLKCHGGGIGGPPPDGPLAVADVDVGAGYAAAVAMPGTQPPATRLYRLELR